MLRPVERGGITEAAPVASGSVPHVDSCGTALDDATLGPTGRPDAWRWLATAGIGYVVGQLAALVLATVAVAIAGSRGGLARVLQDPVLPAWLVACELLGLWIGFGGAAWVVTRTQRRVGLAFRAADAWFIAVGAALQGALYLCYTPILHVSESSKAATQLLGGGPGWLLVIPGCLAVVGAPVFEELFFRGVLLRSLLSLLDGRGAALGTAVAIAIDGVVFGLAHLGSDTWAELPGLGAVGVVLAVLAWRTKRLGPSIVTHASFNLAAVLAFAATR